MDSHRQHEFIETTEEKLRSIYCNIREPQDVANHTQYYSKDRSMVTLDSNKLCGCPESVSDGLNCKGCHAIRTVEKSWEAKTQHNLDYRSLEVGKSLNKSPMYIHPDGGGVSCWSENVSSFSEDSTIGNKPISAPSHSHLDRRVYGKVCIPDHTSYKPLPQPHAQMQHQHTQQHQQQQHQQLRGQQTVSYCKGRYCDEKYSYPHEARPVKTVYTVSGSASSYLHCDQDPSNEQLSRTAIDHRIINPKTNKIISSNEQQQQSPNYARKCPQICSLEEQSPGYSNLYMSTPQFSSEKFASIVPDKNVDYLSRPNTTVEMRIRDDTPKLCESPIQPRSSPMPAVYSHQSKYQSIPKEHIHPYLQSSQQMQQQNLYPRIPNTTTRSIQYISSHNAHKEHLISDVPLSMETQQLDQYQYSRSPITLPSAEISQTKLVQTPSSVEYGSKDDIIYDVRGTISNKRSGLFNNPYNTSQPSNNCCKKTITHHPMSSNCRRESMPDYEKYGKGLEEVVESSSKMSPLNQYPQTGVPANNISHSYRSQQYCYESVHPKYMNKPSYSSSSPTVSSALAVPNTPPSHISQTSHVPPKEHHMQYSQQYIQSYQPYPQAENRQSLQPLASNSASKGAILCNDVCESQLPTSQIASYSRNHQRTSQTITVSHTVISAGPTGVAQSALQPPHPKKSQMPKPNYRELINQVHARRNATSEEELNMQIIKKTLNVDARASKSSETSKLSAALSTSLNQTWPGVSHLNKKKSIDHENLELINGPVTYVSGLCRPETNNSVRPEPTLIAHNSTMPGEKTSSSPLDLSMRTVKTKADSTNCQYQSVSQQISKNNNVSCSYTLPRVNFTPNFSFPSNAETNISSVQVKSNEKFKIEMGKPTSTVKPKVELDQIQAYSMPILNGAFFSSPSVSSETKPCRAEPTGPTVSFEKQLQLNQLNDLHGVSNTLVIKSTITKQPNNRGSMDVRQVRPSVLESNPYASYRAGTGSDSTSTASTTRTLHTINQLPPDTSIMPLIKTTVTDPPPNLTPVINKREETLYITPAPATEDILRGNACSGKKNIQYAKTLTNDLIIKSALPVEHSSATFPCRKRFLQEHKDSLCNTPPLVKQPKLEDPIGKIETCRRAEVPVIAVNERHAEIERSRTAEKSIQAEIPYYKQILGATENNFIGDNITVPTLKREPISPTQQSPPQTAKIHIKSDTSSLIAARIRTKAELKGFTFSPPITKSNDSLLQTTIRIKEEPCKSPSTVLTHTPIMSELNEDYKPESLLDFTFNKTCNSFMQQLLSNPKKALPKKISKPKGNRTEQSEEDISLDVPVLAIENENLKTEAPNEQIVNEISQTTMLSGDIPNFDPTESRSDIDGQRSNFETHKSVAHDIRIQSSITVFQKKMNKMGRDKLRIQQEKRFAARLQHESSSETDNELDRRKSDRLKKPFKKTKSRSNNHTTAKNRFSDCGSDSSGTDVKPLENDERAKTSKIPETAKTNINANNKANRQNILDNNIQTVTTVMQISEQHSVNDPVLFDKYKSKEQQDTDTEIDSGKAVPLKLARKTKSKSIEKVQNNDKNQQQKQKPDGKRVQCGNVNNNDKDREKEKEKEKENEKDIDKKENKQKQKNLRICHNTITRSKRKRELELQLANSKVLRNDKIIRNSTTTTTKIKRKYVKKFSNAHTQSSTNKETFNKKKNKKDMHNQCIIMSTRLRTRKHKDSLNANNKQTVKTKKDIISKGDTGKINVNTKTQNDRQTDILMEVYRYKRSLKIPPSLITIKHPNNHKIATNLPEELEKVNNRLGIATKSHRPNDNASQSKISEMITKTAAQSNQPRSIIDVLHSRVLKSTFSLTKSKIGKNSNSKIVLNENSKNEKSRNISVDVTDTSLTNHQSTSQKRNDESNKMAKKHHFSIFETKVLQTKTRTESKMQQKREIIREIFVGDERPASAPPEITPAAESDIKMTYEQKYEQFLQQMNIAVNENFSKFSKKSTETVPGSSCLTQHDNYKAYADGRIIKQEDDTESASAIDADEKADADNPPDNASTASTGPLHNNFRRRKCGKYFRRKGSSGFDYIRKKKKPASICTSSTQNIYATSKLDVKSELDYEAKEKTENDVCREIHKWVLNKGVGQSTMHKAARLGYIDVVVYCLERLCLNPDQKDNAGYTPLHEACTNGWLEIAKILLQYGAKHSEAAQSGIRPLHEASENDHEEIVRLLLSYGADPLLATYAGQTPLMLASSPSVRDVLKNHLYDVQCVGPDHKPWRFEGPWKIFDAAECGYDIFSGAPNNKCDTSRALNRSFGSNATLNKKPCNQYDGTKAVISKCAEVFDNINRLNSVRLYNDGGTEFLMKTTSDSESEMFEFEEADVLLPPLYLLKDEGAEKWVLLSDLCNLLKVKSKDTLLNKIYPSSSMSPAHKDLMRELKMSDFLEKATCLQLLCAGEKINICASKVVLIKYNENVRNLLGVKTILMKF